MLGRRIIQSVTVACLAFLCLSVPLAGPGGGGAQAAQTQVVLGCSISNPPSSYRGDCQAGLNLGSPVHLAAATNHDMAGGYELWITCRRVDPAPAVGCGSNVSRSSPYLLNAYVRNAKSYHHIVVYDFQAMLVYHPSGTPLIVKRSAVVRVAWAPRSQVVVIQRVRQTGSVIVVRVELTHGELTRGEDYLDLRIINGPGRFTTIDHCPRPTVTSQGAATHCLINVDCSHYGAQIEVQGRVVNLQGEVWATSESLFLCGSSPPPPPPGNATWIQIKTPCTATSDHPNRRQLGNACVDGTTDSHWSISQSSATLTFPGFRASYTWTVPSTIPPTGATVSVSATEVNDVTVVGVPSSDFPFKPGSTTAFKTPPAATDVPSTASGSIGIDSFKATKGTKATLVVGLGYGDIAVIYTFEAQ